MRAQKGRLKKLEKVAGTISDRAKIEQAIPEVERLVAEALLDYDDPEATVQRERQVEELKEINRRRFEAETRGEGPDQVAPLPPPDPAGDEITEEINRIIAEGRYPLRNG